MDTNYELGEDIVYRTMGDEAIVLDAVSGEHFDLNVTGTEIFLGIANKKDLHSIIKMQMRKYGEEEAVLKKDIEECVVELLEKQIIKKSV